MDKVTLTLGALQDVCATQGLALTGLVAHLSGSALQGDIASTTRRLILLGQQNRHIGRCSAQALALYLFLVTVADGQGLSYYPDGAIVRLLPLDGPALARVRQELIATGLIAYLNLTFMQQHVEELARQAAQSQWSHVDFLFTWPGKINRLAVQDLFRLQFVKDKANAILDRILHHAETIVIEGRSYRMKDRIEP